MSYNNKPGNEEGGKLFYTKEYGRKKPLEPKRD